MPDAKSADDAAKELELCMESRGYASEVHKMNIATLIPTRGLVASDWAFAHATSVQEWEQQRVTHDIDVSIITRKLLPVDAARNELVTEALNKNVDYVFFQGDDIILPPNALTTLLETAHELQVHVVSGLYFLKSGRPAAFHRVKDPTSPTGLRLDPIDPDEEGNVVQQCDTVGLDFCLIRADTFTRLAYPWFDWKLLSDGKHQSEDVGFFDACNAIGIHPYVDTSLRAKHLNLYAATNEIGKQGFQW